MSKCRECGKDLHQEELLESVFAPGTLEFIRKKATEEHAKKSQEQLTREFLCTHHS